LSTLPVSAQIKLHQLDLHLADVIVHPPTSERIQIVRFLGVLGERFKTISNRQLNVGIEDGPGRWRHVGNVTLAEVRRELLYRSSDRYGVCQYCLQCHHDLEDGTIRLHSTRITTRALLDFLLDA
jgi:hypothetical protein